MKKMLILFAIMVAYCNMANAYCYLYCGPSGKCWEVNVWDGGSSWTQVSMCSGGPWMEMLDVCPNVSPDGEKGCDGQQINHAATSVLVDYFMLNNTTTNVPQADLNDFNTKLQNGSIPIAYIDGSLFSQQVLSYFLQNNP